MIAKKETDNSYFSGKHWPALKFVKFFCVAVMIFVHAHLLLITNEKHVMENVNGYFYRATEDAMAIGLFVFMLPIIAGTVFRISLGDKFSRGYLRDYSFSEIFKLAAFLTLVGFAMNVLVGGIFAIFSWNILQLMALSLLIIVALAKSFSLKSVFLVGLISLLAAEPMRNLFGNSVNSYWVAVLIGDGGTFMFWPFFPWFSVIVFGFCFGHFYLKYRNSLSFKLNSFALGSGLLLVAIMRQEISPHFDPQNIFGANIFQPKIGFVLASMGLFCILVVAADYFFNGTKFKKYGIINVYSQGIIWIYVFQMWANFKLAPLIKNYVPMDGLSWEYLILPVTVWLASWLVGALSVKLLQEKLIVIKLKKIDEK